MPSTMIHLLTAYKYNPEASTAFWIGNIIPDSVRDWKEKDKTHFRDRPDRFNALEEMAHSLNLEDELSEGILLHLFLDYLWDSSPMHNYIKNFTGDSWFIAYRQEIALAGAWLYHHVNWSKRVWDEMISFPTSGYEKAPSISKENVPDFIARNSKWHYENNIGPSPAFPPDFVEEFTDKAVIEFKKWIESMKK